MYLVLLSQLWFSLRIVFFLLVSTENLIEGLVVLGFVYIDLLSLDIDLESVCRSEQVWVYFYI